MENDEEYNPKKYSLKLSGTVKKRKTDDTSQYSEENMKESKISNFFKQRTTSIDSLPALSSEEEESDTPKKKKHNQKKKHENNEVILNNFVLFKEIANGTFGKIIYGFSIRDNVEVAIKKEVQFEERSQLKLEGKIYTSLLNIPKNYDITGIHPIPQNEITGVPKFFGAGKHKNNHYLILEFLGPNLGQLFRFCNNKKFTIITVFLIAIQILNRIENLHKYHYIHRDIKPENFAIGTGNKSNIIYLIDFGLSKRYKNPKSHQHIPYKDNRKLIGTVRYISINTHMGVEQSRRDDLESIAYVLILFLRGSLPWQKISNDKTYQKVMKKKMQIPTEILCYELPEEISIFLNYAKSLRFEDRPDYDYLKSIFIKGITWYATNCGLEKETLFFDWLIEDRNFIQKILKREKQIINEENLKDETNIEKKYIFDKLNDNIKKEMPKLNKVLYNNVANNSSSNSSSSSSLESISNKSKTNKAQKNGFKLKKSKDSENESENKNEENEEESSDRTIKFQFNGTLQGKTNDEKENKIIQSLVSSLKTKEKIDKYINTIISGSNYSVSKSIKSNNDNDNDSYSIDNLKEISTPTYNMKVSIDDNYAFSNRKLNYQLAESSITFHMKSNNSNNALSEVNIKKESKFQELNSKEKTTTNSIKNEVETSLIELENPNLKETKLGNSHLNLNNSKNAQKSISGTMISEQTNSNKKKNISFEISNDNNNCYNKKFQTEKFNNSLYKHLSTFPHNPKEKKSFEDMVKKGKSTEKIKTLKMLSDTGGNLSNIQITLAKENIIRINTEPVSNYYIILDNVGQGSYGKVKKVKHRKLNEIRAMKIVDKKSASSHHEIEILRKISHPNIINIFEIFEDYKQYYIICEYCEGGELFSIISRKGFFSEKEAAKIIQQILQAVNYLHTNNIIHRDLKPENIIFVSNDKDIIKLIDFGTAIEIKDKGKKLKKVIGTPYYIAPEVLKENYNEKCDIWSCGVILFILLCGYPPFNGRSNKEIYNKIENSAPIFYDEEWNEISKEAKDLCKKMLKKNPNERLSAEESLKHNWFNIINTNFNDEKISVNQNKIIENMAQFVHHNKFKQAILQFISTQFDLKKEEEDLRNIFKEFDKSNKGVISKEDFKAQLEKIYGVVISSEMADEVFQQLDLDNSGSISYNEFITSVIGNRKNITEERLEKAFKMLDKDNNGLLSVDEIKSFFGGDDETWKEVLKDVDENGDGEVDFKEFQKIMIGLKNSQLIGEEVSEVQGII